MVGYGSEILGFECGGQQWVSVCSPRKLFIHRLFLSMPPPPRASAPPSPPPPGCVSVFVVSDGSVMGVIPFLSRFKLFTLKLYDRS